MAGWAGQYTVRYEAKSKIQEEPAVVVRQQWPVQETQL